MNHYYYYHHHHYHHHHYHYHNLRVNDNPEKAQGIEIYNCYEYLRMRLHWNGCGLILHELCHLIHQVVLNDGLDNKTIQSIYNQTYKENKYNCTLRRDWAGRDIDYDQAYAMVNHKEFFAEMSVTYLSCHYSELDKNDKTTMVKSCPPLLSPIIMEQIKMQYFNDHSISEIDFIRLCGNITNNESNQIHSILSRLIGLDHNTKKKRLPHCNKFYPFTRGQLKHYDPKLYKSISNVWDNILLWEDDVQSTCTCC